jgi:hypothetical protein
MKKSILWSAPALALLLLGLAGCSKSSEAKINVTNRSAVELKVSINELFTTLAVGASDTIIMTWPGRDILDVTVMYYPTGKSGQARYQYLELLNGEVLDINLMFD